MKSTSRIVAIATLTIAALTLGACSSTTDPQATNPYGPGAGAFDRSLLDEVSPGQRGHMSLAQIEMRRTVSDTVNFTTDSSDLSPDARRILDGQSAWLAANSQYTIVLEGHADERGTRSYNLSLGARRAEAARDYLLSRGVSASRIDTMSWGKEAPLETCSQESCWFANRRAVTMVK